MANLKDIRTRISSVKTTRQVTSAMKMVSAARFKKSQDYLLSIRPYVDKLTGILLNLAGSDEGGFSTPFVENRVVEKVLVVVITSNRGLCGAFNSNVIKQAERTINTTFQAQHALGNVDVFAIGKQGQKVLKMHGYEPVKAFNDIYLQLDYNSSSSIAEQIMNAFVQKKYDKVVMVYNEFVNAAVQNVKVHQFLPLEVPKVESHSGVDFTFEPDKSAILDVVIPKALKTMFFHELLESVAAEHGARMTSMHKATDNATDLLGELQLMYNKARQGAITNEILEIVGGAEALRK
jgi:F-type H+-transporting ATPase subunit gamma